MSLKAEHEATAGRSQTVRLSDCQAHPYTHFMRSLPLLFLVAICVIAPQAGAQDIAARLDSAMRVAEHNGFTGAVRVERAGQVLLEKGYGYANRATKAPFTPATVVQIGSNTKDFTAVAMLQLQEQKRLSFQDHLGKYFPSAPADKKDITIQQLMNHRAGFPAGVGPDFEPIGRAQLVDRALHTTLLFPPGTKESYSNTGFSLLAAIIEQVTGKTYDHYVQDAILTPLNLTRTGFILPGFQLTDLAHGYLAAGTDAGTMLEKPHAADGPYWNLRGNGGMLSTLNDMHAFYAALFETSKLMTPATRALRFNPDEPIGLAGSDGVNFFLYDRFPGMRTELIIASTNAAVQAPVIRRELGRVLGLPDVGGGQEPMARRTDGKPAPEGMASVIASLVGAINTGNTATLRKFIEEHFTSDPGAPSIEERLTRIGRLHEMLGEITLKGVETFPTGPAEAILDSRTEGAALLRVEIDAASPYRIHALQIRVGG